jgi:hypothetical protein
MKITSAVFRLLCAFLLSVSLGQSASAQEKLGTPAYVDYQGVLFNGEGQLLGGDEGKHFHMQFRIYDQASNGRLIYSETQVVSVRAGRFSVRLGKGVRVAGEAPVVTKIVEAFGGEDRYLEVTVIPEGESTGTPISPRLAFQSAPFSFVSLRAVTADLADRATVADTVSSSDVALLSRDGQTFTGETNIFSKQVGVGVAPAAGIGLHVQDPGAETGRLHVGGRGSDGARKIVSFGDGDRVYLGENAVDDRMELRATSFYFNSGNVGIHTEAAAPRAPLEVRGDIRMGAGGNEHAASGEEALRMTRGYVNYDGRKGHGSGWTVTKVSTGIYRVNFRTAFSGNPTIVATSTTSTSGGTDYVVSIHGIDKSYFNVYVRNTDGELWDQSFMFIALGPR